MANIPTLMIMGWMGAWVIWHHWVQGYNTIEPSEPELWNGGYGGYLGQMNQNSGNFHTLTVLSNYWQYLLIIGSYEPNFRLNEFRVDAMA